MDNPLLLQIIITAMMCGIILFVQIIHYPLFREYSRNNFSLAMKEHQRRTSYVVVPLMLLELGLAIFQFQNQLLYIVSLVFLLAVWISTFFLQVPSHKRLSENWNQEAYNRLVRTNWIRTTAWMIRLITLTISAIK